MKFSLFALTLFSVAGGAHAADRFADLGGSYTLDLSASPRACARTIGVRVSPDESTLDVLAGPDRLLQFESINRGKFKWSSDFGTSEQKQTVYANGVLSEAFRDCSGILFQSCKPWGETARLERGTRGIRVSGYLGSTTRLTCTYLR